MFAEERKRFVFVGVRCPHMGGLSTYVEAMSDALTNEGLSVQHVSLLPGAGPARYPTTVIFRREALHAGPIFRGHANLMRRLWAVPLVAFKWADRRVALNRYRRLIESFGPEAVVVFTEVKPKMMLRESGYVRRPGGPIMIGQYHSSFDSLNFETWLREALPAHYSDLDALTALTDEDARKFEQLVGVRCFGIGNPLPQGIRRSRHDSRIAVALARFTVEKQLDVMIRAFAEATSIPELDGWALHMYGDGYLREDLQACIDNLGVGARVRLMGRTDDVASVLETATLNLLTSSYEGFGMTILEAAAAGIPSVVFDCSPGVRGLVPPEAGYLVPPNDEQAYVRALRKAMTDGPDRVKKGMAAAKLTERFAPSAIVEKFSHIVCDVDRFRQDTIRAQLAENEGRS